MSIVNCDETTTHIAGMSFDNDDGSSRWDLAGSLGVKRGVQLIREPENKFDKNAVKIIFTRGGFKRQIGYLPKNYALVVAKCLDSGKFKVKFARLSGSLKRNAVTFALMQVIEKKMIKLTAVSCDAVKQTHVRARDSDVCIYCGVTCKGVQKSGSWRFVRDSDLESKEAAKRKTWMQESSDTVGLQECVKVGHSINSSLGYCTWCGKGSGAVLRDGEYLSEGEKRAACKHTALTNNTCQKCGKGVLWPMRDGKAIDVCKEFGHTYTDDTVRCVICGGS